MPELRDDIALEKRLTDSGCPFAQGSVDAVIWLLGYRAGLLRALETMCEALDRPVPLMGEAASLGRLQ